MGTLFIVATPIGNLSDITLRALEVLKNVSTIACEDTRVSRKLLDCYDIKKPLVSLHQHSSEKVIGKIIDRLKEGENIAYISDSGTPGISDPGGALVKAVQDARNKMQGHKQIPPVSAEAQTKADQPRIKIVPIPGPSALTAAISVSGIIKKEFYFAGFLPKKKGRQTKFNQLKNISAPIVIYESALRLERTLKDIEKYFGQDCEVFIAREMTKMFEECWGGKISEVLKNISDHKLKGEIVVILKN